MRSDRKLKYPKPYYEDMTATIKKPGNKKVVIDSWRYYSIMDSLRWMGVDRLIAQDAAKRCCRTHEEVSFNIGDISIELKKKEVKKTDGKKKNVLDDPGDVSD